MELINRADHNTLHPPKTSMNGNTTTVFQSYPAG